MSQSDAVLSEKEIAALRDACRALPPARGNYHVTDFVENLLLTVVDFQMHTTAVVRAMEHFKTHAKAEASDFARLTTAMARFPDDREGDGALARWLWGYNLWTRAAMLRRLVAFFENQGVTDQKALEEWAARADFHADFEGRVKGLGYAVFHWLILRQGVDSIKPDVHVLRFVADAVGRPVRDTAAVAALIQVAGELGIPAHRVDWAIWEAGRGGAV